MLVGKGFLFIGDVLHLLADTLGYQGVALCSLHFVNAVLKAFNVLLIAGGDENIYHYACNHCNGGVGADLRGEPTEAPFLYFSAYV